VTVFQEITQLKPVGIDFSRRGDRHAYKIPSSPPTPPRPHILPLQKKSNKQTDKQTNKKQKKEWLKLSLFSNTSLILKYIYVLALAFYCR